MSAWPEAVYIINKLNYALDAMFDIDQNGIQNINNLNDRIDFLRRKVGYQEPNHPEQAIESSNIIQHQDEIMTLLENLQETIDTILGPDGAYNEIVQQLTQFETDLQYAQKPKVVIGDFNILQILSQQDLIGWYSVGLILSV